MGTDLWIVIYPRKPYNKLCYFLVKRNKYDILVVFGWLRFFVEPLEQQIICSQCVSAVTPLPGNFPGKVCYRFFSLVTAIHQLD